MKVELKWLHINQVDPEYFYNELINLGDLEYVTADWRYCRNERWTWKQCEDKVQRESILLKRKEE